MQNLLKTTSIYVPGREVLCISVDLSDYLIDYYIHAGKLNESVDPEHDQKLKELIACFAAHLTLQPASTSHAWTLHLHAEKPFSLFVTGSVDTQYIVGHVLARDIRHTDVNTLHAQVIRNGESGVSAIQSESSEISQIVEHFYQMSEQLPVRIRIAPDSDTTQMLAAMPGHDRQWSEEVSFEEAFAEAESGKLMRRCGFEFNCDCSPEKLVPFFRTIEASEIEALFGDDDSLIVTCPRCGRHFPITRDDLKLHS